jgi:hypothetical protein
METLLLAVTVVSLVVALVASVAAARFARDERRRAAARVAALTVAAGVADLQFSAIDEEPTIVNEPRRAPWTASAITTALPMQPEPVAPALSEVEGLPLQHGFLHTSSAPRTGGGPQRALALAAVVLFVAIAAGLVWNLSEGRAATSAAAVAAATPLELVSLRHDRQSSRLAVSGLVRNPGVGRPVERLSAVVFLFDQQGTFITSAKAPVDFVTLGAGDESPFVVSLDAPSNVARYRVSFRTDGGIMPHIDRRGAPPIADAPEQPVSVTLK